MSSTNPIRLLRPCAVAAKLGISRATLYNKAKADPQFPRSFRLGPGTRATFWDEASLDEYIAACAKKQ